METKIIEVVSNASMNVYPGNTLSSFSNFLPEQINLEGDWEVAVMEISYPSLFQNITDGRFRYKQKDGDDTIGEITIPPGLYFTLDEILQEMKKQAAAVYPSKNIDFEWKVNNRDYKVEITLPHTTSVLNIVSEDLAHILGFPALFLAFGKGPHKSMYAVDILRVHSLMIYTDIIQYGIVGDTKASLLRCFPLMSKVRNDSVYTNQYMNYRSFEKLQFKKLLKNSFHSIYIALRDTTGEFIPFFSVGITRLTLMFRKINHS